MDKTYVSHKTKSQFLNETVCTSDQFIPYFIVTETHLKSHHFDAEVDCPNYSIIRSDRPKIIKGGVAIYIHNKLSVDATYKYADTICQAACAYSSTLNLLIIGVYRPPSRNLPDEEKSFNSCLKSIQEVIGKHPNADIQIQGDLNFPYINWHTREINRSNRTISEQNSARNLLTFMEKNLLVQLVNENTRADKSILDILLTNNDQAIHSVTTEKTVLSDHDFVNCALLYNKLSTTSNHVQSNIEKSELDKLNMNKADYDSIRRDLGAISWPTILNAEEQSVTEMFNSFTEIITKVCTNHAPQHKDPSGNRSSKFIPKHRRSLLRTRRHVNYEINKCKYLKPNNHNTKEKLENLMKKKESLELKIRDCINKEQVDNEKALIRKIKTNPKAFYTYAKKHCKSHCSVGPLIDEYSKLHSDPAAMCNILQKQYQKAFSDPASGCKKTANRTSNTPGLSDINFTEEDIITAINDIPVHSAPGPDKIPSKLLKECKHQIASALLIIWRKSLDTGEIPDKLKEQTIIPIYKKDSKAIPANYRPVSLTSHIIKLFERVVRKHIVNYLEKYHIIHASQHGFRPCRSCLTQLLHHLESVLNILETNNADVIYLDLSKAFDKVNHSILIHKLEASGITGNLLNWVKSFLNNRTQKVVIDGATSIPANVQSGVPQGTVLGPVLFIIYMNDLHEVIKNSLLKCFADDSKLIMSIKNPEDRIKLMEDLKAVLQWTEDNSMKFNADKFQLLQHGNDQNLKQPYILPDGQILEGSTAVRDLGLNISDNLKWKHHISTITDNATKFANWILRTIRSRDEEIMMTMFRSYVLSRLEYVSPAWNPMMIGDITEVESVQRSFTAKISGLEDQDYWQRLQSLKLFSLQRRRERYMFIHLWKIYKGLAPNDIQFEFQNHIRLGPQCRRRNYQCRTASLQTTRYNFFSSTAPRIFNIMPAHIKNAKNPETLKLRLDRLLCTLPDHPPTPGYRTVTSNSLLELTRLINQNGAQMATTPGEDEETVGSRGAR